MSLAGSRNWSGVRAACPLAALLLAAPPTPELEGPEILARAEQVRSPDLDYAVDFRLDVTDPRSAWQARSAEYTLIAHGKDHSLVVMREPEPFYAGALLIADGLYWLLLPRSEKPLQLSAQHVLNGDIANGDLARGNLLASYEARLDGQEVVRGEDCFRLELERSAGVALYRRIRAWVTEQGFRPRKFEYYGETGARLKVAYYEDYREGELGLRPMRIEVESYQRPGEKSVLTFSNLRKFDASRLTFTRESLPAVRDAFLAGRRPDGTPPQPEDAFPAPALGAARP